MINSLDKILKYNNYNKIIIAKGDIFMFKKGDVVQAKKEFLDKNEAQKDTIGIVVDYSLYNDYLQVGVLNPQNYFLPPIFNARGSCYEIVKRSELNEF